MPTSTPTTTLTLAVGGYPALADALDRSGNFVRVVPMSSTTGLRSVIGELAGVPANQLVFIFNSAMVVDTPQTLEYLIGRISAKGYRVIIVDGDATARDLVAANPGAGMVKSPFTLNVFLGAISGLGLDVALNPTDDGFDTLPAPGEPFTPAAPVPAPVAPAFVAPVAPKPEPKTAPKPEPRPQPKPEASAPAAPNPWANPVRPEPAPTPKPEVPAFEAPKPEPVAAVNTGGWAAPAADPTPVTTPSPVEPAPVSGWSAPAPQDVAPVNTAPVSARPPAAAPTPGALFGGAGDEPADLTATEGPSTWDAPAGEPLVATTPPAPVEVPRERPSLVDLANTPPGSTTPTAPAARPSLLGMDQAAPVAVATPAPVWSGGPSGTIAARADTTASIRQTHRLGNVIGIVSPKGGTGKSTVSVNLAAYLGLRLRSTGKRVCLIDGNFQQADVGKLIGSEFTPNIVSLVKDPESLAPDRIESKLIHLDRFNLSVLLGPAMGADGDPTFINADLYNKVLDVLATRFDYVLIDTPVAELYHDLFRRFVLPRSDKLVTIVVPALHTLMNVDGWLRSITKDVLSGGDGVDSNTIGIILNQAMEGIACDPEMVRSNLSTWRYYGSIPMTAEWIRAVNEGELVAGRGYHELNSAFSEILWNITGEDILTEGFGGFDEEQTGGLAKLFGRFRGKK